jgi:hypothetical protein
MSLILKISTSELKNSFVVYDCTGNYSSDNQGGYGVYNPKIKDVEDAFLEIYTPAIPYSATAAPYKIKVYSDMPNDKEFGFEIFPEMIGQHAANSGIESGKYTIRYTVSGKDKNGVSYTKSVMMSFVFIKNVSCCIDKLGKKVGKDAFKDDKQKKIIELENLLQSAQYHIDCDLLDSANDIIEYLKGQCKCCCC